MQQENLLKVSEVAAALRVSRASAYRLIHSGDLRSVRIGKLLRVRESELSAFLTPAGQERSA